MRAIVAIDPGPVMSALVTVQPDGVVTQHEHWTNESMLDKLRRAYLPGALLAIEMIASYGMPVGAEVFETCVWIGRFIEASGVTGGAPHVAEGVAPDLRLVKRLEVKSHLCHSGKANDANIRQAIIDRYGGKDRAIGRKAKPGPLYGITGDCWAALAVGLVVLDRQRWRAAA